MAKQRNSVCICTGSELTKTKKGVPELQIFLQDVESGESKRKRLTFTEGKPEVMEWATKDLRTCGWTSNDIREQDGLGTTKFNVVEQEDTYNGKTTWRVKYLNAFRVGLDSIEADEFADAFLAYAMDVEPGEVTDENRAPTPVAADDY